MLVTPDDRRPPANNAVAITTSSSTFSFAAILILSTPWYDSMYTSILSRVKRYSLFCIFKFNSFIIFFNSANFRLANGIYCPAKNLSPRRCSIGFMVSTNTKGHRLITPVALAKPNCESHQPNRLTLGNNRRDQSLAINGNSSHQ